MRTRALAAALAALALAVSSFPGTASAQNSTRKIRPKPSAQAERVGSAVAWRADVETALADARKLDRPVFWYVPTLRGSRMDRQAEVDRYMRAGPLSWPELVTLLNDHTVPVRAAASRALQKQFGIRPGEFIEPGYVLVAPSGEVVQQLDKLSTFHRPWLLRGLRHALEVEAPEPPKRDAATDLFATVEQALRDGDRAAVRAGLTTLRDEHGEHPLGWKAAAELEGHGPLLRGFEVATKLPAAVLDAAVTERVGSQAPAGAYGEDELWARGTAFLLGMQERNGGFEDSWYDFGGTDSLPNVHAAITAIAGEALLEAQVRQESPEPRIETALTAIVERLLDSDSLNREDRDEIAWAHVYTIRMAVRWLALRPDDADTVRPLLERAVLELIALQPDDGAWFHEYPNPFVIASVLVALRDAEETGVAIAPEVFERGAEALRKCRAASGAFSYGYSRRGKPRATIPSASGRMPLCEHALALCGLATQDSVGQALASSFEHHALLESVRKYDDHANRHGHGGFFFWYDVHARVDCIGWLEPGAGRDRWRDQQRAQILALPEIDGCFVDSHELGRVYGTAMGLICLARLARL